MTKLTKLTKRASTIETVKLLRATLVWRRWAGVLTLALIETGPNAGFAIDISTYTGGPRRKLGFELSIDRLEGGRLADASAQAAVKALEPPR